MIYQADTGSTVTIVIAAIFVGYIMYTFIRTRKRMNKPPSENIRILSDKNFSSTVGNGVSLVDFWAAWCGPCKIQGPIVDEIADEMGDQANICKMDVDQNPETARKFGIQNIPTLLIFQNGKPVEKFVGVKPKHALVKALKSYI